MKLALCIFGVLIAAVAVKGIQDTFKNEMNECKAELNIDNLEEKLSNPPKFDNPELNCFNACLIKKIGQLVNGKLVLEKAVEITKQHWTLTEEQVAGLTDCVTKANELTDECELAGAFIKCVYQDVKLPTS